MRDAYQCGRLPVSFYTSTEPALKRRQVQGNVTVTMGTAQYCSNRVSIIWIGRKECLGRCVGQQRLNERLHVFSFPHHCERLSQHKHSCPKLCAFSQHAFQSHSCSDFLSFVDNKIKRDRVFESCLSEGCIKHVVHNTGDQAGAFSPYLTTWQAHDDP